MIALSFAPIQVPGDGSRTAHALLEQQVALHWPQIPHPLPLEKGTDGKPRLAGFPHCHFNLSHSGAWVACVLGHRPVGIDLQQHRTIPTKVAKKFTLQEQQWLSQHPQDFLTFG